MPGKIPFAEPDLDSSSMLKDMTRQMDVSPQPATRKGMPGSRDMLSLSRARMSELIAALEEERTIADRTTAIPRRSRRVARLLMREAVRLIRLGTRAEVANAALELAQALTRPTAERLASEHPQAHRLLTSAADALAAATPPSSAGGEMSVLRSWNGKALKAVAMVSRSVHRAVPRADLRAQLDVNESHLSHLLSDLEAAGLVVRVRTGRAVMVHLGLVGRSDHVQQMLPPDDSPPEPKAGTQREQAPRLATLKDLNPLQDNVPPPRPEAVELIHAFANLEIHTYDYDIENVSKEPHLAAASPWSGVIAESSREPSSKHFEGSLGIRSAKM
jgi:DNA-binding transcriptional ArsR family regulator